MVCQIRTFLRTKLAELFIDCSKEDAMKRISSLIMLPDSGIVMSDNDPDVLKLRWLICANLGFHCDQS
jgi:hypothetical protein